MEAGVASKGDVAVAGSSKKPDLKRKHQDDVKDREENEENCGPIPIVKLEVSLFTLVKTRLHKNVGRVVLCPRLSCIHCGVAHL